MRYPSNIREEELKNKVAADFFHKYDCTGIIKDIDFAVKAPPLPLQRRGIEANYLLWAEAKKNATDIMAMLAQLVLTIGKARTFNEVLPPKFLGCFDCEKIAFIPYADIQDIFHQNDFNWNVTPSNRETKEFKQIYAQINSIINNGDEHKTYRFDFEKDEKSLKLFILKNFMPGGEISKIRIDRNNFISVYAKWRDAVMPTIQVSNWDMAKKGGIIDGDFYLADLLSADNKTLEEKLFVVLRQTHYEMNRHENEFGFFTSSAVEFSDKQKAHNAFWAIYERPPLEAYWDYIIERRDLLLPQDVRERKGAFFTPPQWVAKAHEYLAKTFGESWQDEYYVWDNSAGTGNLLAGLVNKDNVWASTLDKADVDVMRQRIENGANLWKEQAFQFDFLNDDFERLPPKLREIINDPAKREKLIFLINPPYGEATTGQYREHKGGVKESKTKERFDEILGGLVLNEKYVQFFARIYEDMPGCKMAAFVTPKYICAPNMKIFRDFWKAKYLGGFATSASTHDNCRGEYPICLFIWDLAVKINFPEKVPCDVFNENEEYDGVKNFYSYEGEKYISDWLREYYDKKDIIGFLRATSNDFQNSNHIIILSIPTKNDAKKHMAPTITPNNLTQFCIYFSVRHCIPATWLNDRDQFLYPNDGWKTDFEFQSDCLAYALFHGQNKIKSREGVNHWLPFTEAEVGCEKRFESRFMSDFINGKIKTEREDLFAQNSPHPLKLYGKSSPARSGELNTELNIEPNLKLDIEPKMSSSKFPASSGVPALPAGCAAVGGAVKFSSVAKNVFDAGRELWKYYHNHPCPSKGGEFNVNASFYDIREYFQGSKNGKMNTKSYDEEYNRLIGELRAALKVLARKIEPKVYLYGFLKAYKK